MNVGFTPINEVQKDSLLDIYFERMRKNYAGYKKYNYPVKIDYSTPKCSFQINGEVSLKGILNSNFRLDSITNVACDAANLDSLKIAFLSVLFATNPKIINREIRRNKQKKGNTETKLQFAYKQDSTFLWLLGRSEKESTGFQKFHKKDKALVRMSVRNKDSKNDSLSLLGWACKKDIIIRERFRKEESNQLYHPKSFIFDCEENMISIDFSHSKKWRKLKKEKNGFNLAFGLTRTLGEFR